MKASTLRFWSWLHKWSSVAGSMFLLLLCLTGLPLIFHDEIEHAFEAPPRETRRVAAGRDGPALDDFVAHALGQGHGVQVNYVMFEPDAPYARIGTSHARDPTNDGIHTHWFDLAAGIALAPPESGADAFLDLMLRLHTDLYAGLPGTLFLGAMGLLLAAALVSGTVLYGPFMRKLPFGAVRRGAAPRTRWLDIHNLVGIGTLAWLGVVGLTGAINALEIPVGQMWRTHSLLPMIQRHAGERPAIRLAPLSEVVATARGAMPGTQVLSVVYPGMPVSGPRHFLVIARGDRHATRQLIRAALVDGETGRIAAQAAMPWYVQALSFSQPLHYGDYGGLPLKLIWAALDMLSIVVLGSGLYLWLKKHRRERGAGTVLQRAGAVRTPATPPWDACATAPAGRPQPGPNRPSARPGAGRS